MADVFNDRGGMSGKGRIRICATVSILGLIDLIALLASSWWFHIIPLTAKLADSCVFPAAFLAVHVYLPAWRDWTFCMINKLSEIINHNESG